QPHSPHILLFSPRPSPAQTSPLSLHDALPISWMGAPATGSSFSCSTATGPEREGQAASCQSMTWPSAHQESMIDVSRAGPSSRRSEEHTSELQSRFDLVCRLLLEKKKEAIELR